MIPLSHAEPGKRYSITWIAANETTKGFAAYGIKEGVSLTAITNNCGDVLVKTRQRTLAISEPAAFRIKVTGT